MSRPCRLRAGLPLALGRDQARVQPIQIGSLRMGLRQEGWRESHRGHRGIFQLWLQGLLVNLSQRLTVNPRPIANHSFRSVSLRTSKSLQVRRTLELLRRHLPRHLQNMALSVLRDNKTWRIRGELVFRGVDTLRRGDCYASSQELQILTQDSHSEPPLGPL